MNVKTVTNASHVLNYEPMVLPHKLAHAEKVLAYQWMRAAVGDILSGAHTAEEIARMCDRELQSLRLIEAPLPYRDQYK